MISVCMATYNGEKYIREQMDSILKQLGVDDEVIISDDGSTDETKAIIESIEDNRIRYVKNAGTHGFTHNFENALRLAKGDYIILSDQDDVWMDDKISTVMEDLRLYDFVTHDCITVDGDFNIISESRFKEFDMKPGFIRHLIKSRFLGCCMAFNRVLLEAALPFPSNDFLIEHDIWLAAVGFLYFKSTMINKPLIYYRRHENNVSGGGFVEGYPLKIKLKKRGYRLIKLVEIYPKVRKKRGLKK